MAWVIRGDKDADNDGDKVKEKFGEDTEFGLVRADLGLECVAGALT